MSDEATVRDAIDKLVLLLRERAAIRVEHFPEDTPYKGNCSAIDDETDAANELWIENQLNQGNEWAWCYVKITATWRCFSEYVTLGGCSYESEDDFRRDGGYFDQLRDDALWALAERMLEAKNAINELTRRVS